MTVPSRPPPPRPNSITGGGRDDWLSVPVFCKQYGYRENTIREWAREGKITVRKESSSGPKGYRWLIHVSEALGALKNFKRATPRQGPNVVSTITPETWAKFEEVWEDFCAGRCWPTPFGKLKMARGSWLWDLVDPKVSTSSARRRYHRDHAA